MRLIINLFYIQMFPQQPWLFTIYAVLVITPNPCLCAIDLQNDPTGHLYYATFYLLGDQGLSCDDNITNVQIWSTANDIWLNSDQYYEDPTKAGPRYAWDCQNKTGCEYPLPISVLLSTKNNIPITLINIISDFAPDTVFITECQLCNGPQTCYGPTNAPTRTPTSFPTITPTISTFNPTITPSKSPTFNPTTTPSYNPTTTPSYNPTNIPTVNPSYNPTKTPTKTPILNGMVLESTVVFSDSDEGSFNNNSMSDDMMLIIIFIVIGIVLLCVIIVIVFLWKRKSIQTSKTQMQDAQNTKTCAKYGNVGKTVSMTPIGPANDVTNGKNIINGEGVTKMEQVQSLDFSDESDGEDIGMYTTNVVTKGGNENINNDETPMGGNNENISNKNYDQDAMYHNTTSPKSTTRGHTSIK
eukprot:57411_1